MLLVVVVVVVSREEEEESQGVVIVIIRIITILIALILFSGQRAIQFNELVFAGRMALHRKQCEMLATVAASRVDGVPANNNCSYRRHAQSRGRGKVDERKEEAIVNS